MRILALSDIHGAYELARQIARAEQGIDVLVLAGDLTTNGTRVEAAGAIADLRSLAPRVLAVAGNMDTREIERAYEDDGVCISGRGVCIGDVSFFGVSGCPLSPLHTPFELSEDAILDLAEKGWKEVADCKYKIFVPHAPPYGTTLDVIRSGRHVGSTAVRTFVEKRQPDAVICGHIHESSGVDSIGRTRMVNCGSVRDEQICNCRDYGGHRIVSEGIRRVSLEAQMKALPRGTETRRFIYLTDLLQFRSFSIARKKSHLRGFSVGEFLHVTAPRMLFCQQSKTKGPEGHTSGGY